MINIKRTYSIKQHGMDGSMHDFKVDGPNIVAHEQRSTEYLFRWIIDRYSWNLTQDEYNKIRSFYYLVDGGV